MTTYIVTIDAEREARMGEDAIDDEYLQQLLRESDGRARLLIGGLSGIEVAVKVVKA